MKQQTKKQQQEYASLTRAEKKIYDSVKAHFPATSHESALDAAWQGGVKWNFIHK